VVIMAADDAKWEVLADPSSSRSGMLDVWWQDDATGRLMLLLAYLMTRHERWRDDRLRVIVPAPRMQDAADALLHTVNSALDDYRIQAETKVIQDAAHPFLPEVFGDTDLLLLPFRFQDNLIRLPFEGPVDETLGKLPGTMLVAAARDIDLDPEPEEGVAGERATLLDRLQQMEKRLAEAEKAAARAAEKAVAVQAELVAMLNAKTGAINLAEKNQLSKAVDAADREAETARRKALKMGAKLATLEAEAVRQGALVEAASAKRTASPEGESPPAHKPDASE